MNWRPFSSRVGRKAGRGCTAYRWLFVVVAAVWASVSPLASQAVFTDVTAVAGVSYLQHAMQSSPDCIFGSTTCDGEDPPNCEFVGYFCEPERLSGGAAVADVDGDGWTDLYVTRLDAPDVLFRNRGDGTFTDVTAAAGLSSHDLQSNGAAFADVDNDGDPDLYVTVLGEEGDVPNNRYYLYINDGDGMFSEQAIARGADLSGQVDHYGFSIGVGDYDVDGWVDLHTTEWWPNVSSNARLLRNLGAAAPGHFTDVTESAGVELGSTFSFSTRFSDLDRDGWPDLAVAADFGTSRLFWNNGDGTFTDGTTDAGVGTDENGMGSTIGDFDGDGDLDWFVSSIYDPDQTCQHLGCGWSDSGNRLYRNDGGRTFTDVTDAAGVRDGRWGWGSAFFDYDNDSDLDLVLTNGVDFPDTDIEQPFNIDPMRLWDNNGVGAMIDVAAASGLDDTGPGKGLLVFDYDADGDLDIFLVNNGSTPKLYRNDGGNESDWLRVRTIGIASNREGLGALVMLRTEASGPPQLLEVGSSSHFLGQSERTAHFGLGATGGPVEQVRVVWPGGAVQKVTGVPRNSTLLVVEGRGACAVDRAGPVPRVVGAMPIDGDEDLICSLSDNCLRAANRRQRDTDNDGYGNRCDPDFNNDLVVDRADVAYLVERWGTDDADADLDGNGTVDGDDAVILKALFGGPPGPSGEVP